MSNRKQQKEDLLTFCCLESINSSYCYTSDADAFAEWIASLKQFLLSMGCCFGGLAKSQPTSERTLGSRKKRNGDQLSSQKKRQWSSSPEPDAMDKNVSIPQSLVTNMSSCPITINEETKLPQENTNNIPFINQAAIAWHEMRKQWIGDRSKRTCRTPNEPTISWCATYEDLLSTNQPFSKPIPLSEMVDFLVDVWQEDGFYD